ncbi:MAG: hypothetical protein U9P00_12465 [Pseudomonadota bacterium]|nr:hypothetical protein [Pseudomonadota bacterium]
MQRPVLGYQRLVLLLIGSLLLIPAAVSEQRPNRPVSFSRFNRLAIAVSNAPAPVRVDFAVAAVSEMVIAHRNEADRARRDARNNIPGRNPARWALAVDAYAADLMAVVNSVTPDTLVVIKISPENSVSLNIDAKPIMVSFPETLQQAVFEQRVIERFCNLYRCEDLIAEYHRTELSPRLKTSAPRWSFSEQAGPVCATDDGLEFQFQDTTNLSQKRKACGQIVAELNALAEVIAENLSGGAHIDWNRLAIHPVAGEDQQLVELDNEGGSIRMPLPALAATTGLFILVRPWLAAKVKGNGIRQVVINADRLMAPLLNPSF